MQRFRFHPWHLVTGLVLVCSLILAFGYWLRFNSGDTAAQLVGFLPRDNATILYLDVAALRRGGFLDVFSEAPALRDPEYQSFVSRTQFDYTQDLDAVAASFRGRERFFVLRGRFHWPALIGYVNRQGGSCGKSFCQMDGSEPDRRISFYPLRRDLMALAVSPDAFAAYQIRKSPGDENVPASPVWLQVPAVALQSFDLLPSPARPFVDALRESRQILFTFDSAGKDLKFSAYVRCRDASSASQLALELAGAQASLRDVLRSEHVTPRPADISGILLAGSIHQQDSGIVGSWPVPQEFLSALAAGNTP